MLNGSIIPDKVKLDPDKPAKLSLLQKICEMPIKIAKRIVDDTPEDVLFVDDSEETAKDVSTALDDIFSNIGNEGLNKK